MTVTIFNLQVQKNWRISSVFMYTRIDSWCFFFFSLLLKAKGFNYFIFYKKIKIKITVILINFNSLKIKWKLSNYFFPLFHFLSHQAQQHEIHTSNLKKSLFVYACDVSDSDLTNNAKFLAADCFKLNEALPETMWAIRSQTMTTIVFVPIYEANMK